MKYKCCNAKQECLNLPLWMLLRSAAPAARSIELNNLPLILFQTFASTKYTKRNLDLVTGHLALNINCSY